MLWAQFSLLLVERRQGHSLPTMCNCWTSNSLPPRLTLARIGHAHQNHSNVERHRPRRRRTLVADRLYRGTAAASRTSAGPAALCCAKRHRAARCFTARRLRLCAGWLSTRPPTTDSSRPRLPVSRRRLPHARIPSPICPTSSSRSSGSASTRWSRKAAAAVAAATSSERRAAAWLATGQPTRDTYVLERGADDGALELGGLAGTLLDRGVHLHLLVQTAPALGPLELRRLHALEHHRLGLGPAEGDRLAVTADHAHAVARVHIVLA
mmetsp:Transcript_14429/g.37997  ORF Transcript_14429/g.37997 Transcript_14429/m.37997 type:complete len:267 (+) Transcript_14429:583-1383(+)